MTIRANFAINLETALKLSLIELAERPVKAPGLARRVWLLVLVLAPFRRGWFVRREDISGANRQSRRESDCQSQPATKAECLAKPHFPVPRGNPPSIILNPCGSLAPQQRLVRDANPALHRRSRLAMSAGSQRDRSAAKSPESG